RERGTQKRDQFKRTLGRNIKRCSEEGVENGLAESLALMSNTFDQIWLRGDIGKMCRVGMFGDQLSHADVVELIVPGTADIDVGTQHEKAEALRRVHAKQDEEQGPFGATPCWHAASDREHNPGKRCAGPEKDRRSRERNTEIEQRLSRQE